MPRNRVLSFMSQWGGGQPRSPTLEPEKASFKSPPSPANDLETTYLKRPPPVDTTAPESAQQRDQFAPSSPRSPSTPSRNRDSRISSRPLSMIQTYQPYQVEVAQDTPPELQPIFGYLNDHGNKLYQEGYFLKLHDLDSRGRPSPDRVWTECFAQLVGTVLSLWDAAALDQAGEDAEVLPTFINLSDASIKMIESLPMNGAQGGNLQNVLSVSTAANNRYLLHFNSLSSLTQWTAGIRLAMFEHSTLQEAYTGSMIAGKGKYLNSIKQIMDRSKFQYEDWTRVRFGAGTPWKRYWCVVSPPDEKEYAKAQKVLKKTSTYSRAQIPKGDIKFYDTRKVTKKTQPVATITDAFAAYAIYPQSKPLIDQSTLVKLEGLITIHGDRETTTEGFVFVMPEVHAAVSGFEMMLQWIFRVFDTFALYGRPMRLIADTLDQRGLMFAMPRGRNYGYLDTLDVSTLIHTDGSQNWSERQWRKEMKKLTSSRMNAQMERMPMDSRTLGQRRSTTSRASLPPLRNAVTFNEQGTHSSPGSRSGSPARVPGMDNIKPPKRTDSAPPQSFNGSPHKRAASDAYGHRKYRTETPSRLSHEASRPGNYDDAPAPPPHGPPMGIDQGRQPPIDALQRAYSGQSSGTQSPYEQLAAQGASPNLPPPAPVISPPAMTHAANSRPPNEPLIAPELRRAHSNVDEATLVELKNAVQPVAQPAAPVPQQTMQPPPHYNSLPYRDQRDPFGPPQTNGMGYANEGSQWQHPENRQRLSTIPGSPYAAHDAEYFQGSQQQQMPQINGVMHAGNAGENRPELKSLNSSQSISRKPLPKPAMQTSTPAEQAAPYQDQVRAKEPDLPDSPVSNTGVFYDAVVDQDALDLILNNDSKRTSTLASSATPDYASVETESKTDNAPKQKEWKRPGKLKTVGDPDMPPLVARTSSTSRLDTYSKDMAEQAAEMPSVDFGPTYTYKPSSRPTTSGTMTPGDMRKSRSRSGDRLRQSSRSRLSGCFATPSPGDSNRHSYFGPASHTPGPEDIPAADHRHSIAWTPGLVPGGSSPGAPNVRQTLSPEEWVAYRAALAAQPSAPQRKSPAPNLSHQRQASSSDLLQFRRSISRTPPPFARTASGDLSHLQSRTPPSRPNSRGAGAYLNHGPSLQMTPSTPTLTAKEQMHIARATGTAYLDFNGTLKKQDQHSPGLVGALAAREKEKAAFAQGLRSSSVQQAIQARQQQQLQLEAEAQALAHAQGQAQFEMQQRAEQEAQAIQWQQQQVAYRNSMAMSQQHLAMAMHQQQQMQQQQAQSMYGHARAQSMNTLHNYAGYGGQTVQQPGISPQQQAYYAASYQPMQQGQQSRR